MHAFIDALWGLHPRARQGRRPPEPPRAKPQVEPLEARNLLTGVVQAGFTLLIEGSTVLITTNGSNVVVDCDGTAQTFLGRQVRRIHYTGSAGNDFFQSDFTARTTVFAGAGDDTILSGSGADFLSGEDGSDSINGGGGADRILGGLGVDLLEGGGGPDRIFGQEDDDLLFGQAGNDFIDGGVGSEFLAGGDGQDVLLGQQEVDFLFGGRGVDALDGGASFDIVDADNDLILDTLPTGGTALIVVPREEGTDRPSKNGLELDVEPLILDDNGERRQYVAKLPGDVETPPAGQMPVLQRAVLEILQDMDGVISEITFTVTLQQVQANVAFPVFINGTFIGVVNTDALGNGTLVFTTNPDEPDEIGFPEEFPQIDTGTLLRIGEFTVATFGLQLAPPPMP